MYVTRRILQKTLVLITIVGLLCSPLYLKVDASTEIPEKITLEQAIQMALDNNFKLKSLNTKIDYADKNIAYANKQAELAYGKTWSTEEQQVEILKERFLVPQQKVNIWKNLLLDKEQEIKAIKHDVTESYFKILIGQKNIIYNENNIERIEKDIEIKKELLKTGNVTQETIDALNTNLVEAEKKLTEAERSFDSAKIDFNMAISVPFESSFELNTEIADDKGYIIDNVHEFAQKYITKDSSYIKALTAKSEVQLEYDIIRKNTQKQFDLLSDLQEQLLDRDSDIKKVADNIELTIANGYNDLLNLYDDIKINQYKYELSKKQADIYKIRLELGQISQSALNNKIAELDSLQIALEQSKTDYYLAVLKFKQYDEEEVWH